MLAFGQRLRDLLMICDFDTQKGWFLTRRGFVPKQRCGLLIFKSRSSPTVLHKAEGTRE
jgi:hypothetical protein